MKCLDFIVWMCIYPITLTIDEAIRWQWCEHVKYSDDVETAVAFIMVLIYAGIGMALWKRNSK